MPFLNHQDRKDGYRVFVYEDSYSFFQAVENPTNLNDADAKDRFDRYRRGWSSSFDSTDWSPTNWTETERLMKEGWAEGRAKGHEALGALEMPKLPSFRKKTFWGAQGSQIDMRRVYSGQLDRAWKHRRPVESDAPKMKCHNVTILVDICANGGVTSDQMFWQGAAAAWMTTALEEAGRNVRLVIYDKTSNAFHDDGDHGYLCGVVIKDYGYPMDENNLWYFTSHSGVLRRYFFSFALVCSGNYPSASVGSHATYHEGDFANALNSDDGDIEINISSCYTKQSCINQIEKLRKLIEEGEDDE